MNFRYAIKALVSRFSLVWSILLYSVVVLVIVASLCITVLLPLINAITHLETFGAVNDSISNFSDGTGVFADVLTACSALYTDIIDKVSGYSLSVVMSIIVVMVFGRFLLGLMELPLSSCVHSRLTANANLPFTGAFFANLGRSSVYQLSKMMFTIPFDLIMFFTTYFTARLLSYMSLLAIMSPMIIILEFCAFSAFKNTLFCCWQSALIAENTKIFDGLRLGIKTTMQDFGTVFSLMFITVIFSIALIIFFVVFTLGAGLVIVFPVIVLFYNILSMLIFYTNRGHRFYVDPETIISPPASI